jgi:hypothetical protein
VCCKISCILAGTCHLYQGVICAQH